jgi:hypothetical protein
MRDLVRIRRANSTRTVQAKNSRTTADNANMAVPTLIGEWRTQYLISCSGALERVLRVCHQALALVFGDKCLERDDSQITAGCSASKLKRFRSTVVSRNNMKERYAIARRMLCMEELRSVRGARLCEDPEKYLVVSESGHGIGGDRVRSVFARI